MTSKGSRSFMVGKLLELRTAHEYTQEQICGLTGISYNTYRGYEYGDTFPKKEAIIILAKIYGMLPGELFQLLIDGDVIGYPRQRDLKAELDTYRRWRDKA